MLETKTIFTEKYNKWNNLKQEINTEKEIPYFKEFKSYAILSQIKMYSSNRLISHIGGIDLITLKDIKKKINKIIE